MESTWTQAAARARRRPIRLDARELVRVGRLNTDWDLPALVEPAVPGCSAAAWCLSSRATVETLLLRHGAVLLRGFGLRTASDFQEVFTAFAGDLLDYRERSSPRLEIAAHVYTSTTHPPDQSIFPHNENSYQQTWPLRIAFFCQQAAAWGGETPLADCRRILARLDPALVSRFEQRGWMYVRNFGVGFGLPWRTVFQTSDREEVERYCVSHGIACEWRTGDRLRTRARRPAVRRHLHTGEPVWFNHATFFHLSTLPDEVREALLRDFGEEDQPANTYYGDGSPIEPEVLRELRAAYQAETVAWPWSQGDLLIADNMLVAHGRNPYGGERKILVAMADPVSD